VTPPPDLPGGGRARFDWAQTWSHPARLERIVAAAIGVLSFALLLVTHRQLTNDHYMHLAWAQQLLLGELPGRDFVDPGMPLVYVLSAGVQYVWPGPFSEAVLSMGMLALAATMICLVAARLTGSLAAGAAAALFAIALQPRLYSYPKILVPAVALFLLHRYASRPSRARLRALGLWAATATLLRYDLGVYAVLGLGAALLWMHVPIWRRTATVMAEYLAAILVALIPWAAYMQWSEGIGEHIREGIEFARGERNQLFVRPDVPFLSDGSALLQGAPHEYAAALFYVTYALIALGALLLIVRRRLSGEGGVVAAAGVALLAQYSVVILRHPIEVRIRDIAPLLVLVGAWTLAESMRAVAAAFASRRVMPSAVALAVGGAALVTVVCAGVSISMFSNVKRDLDETLLQHGWVKTGRGIRSIASDGTVWPWSGQWPNSGGMPSAMVYLNRCTASTDRLLLTWSAPEYYVFARRAFAGGHAWIQSPAYDSVRDQNRMLARLRQQRVPIVLVNDTRRDAFARRYPLIDGFVREAYVAVGHYKNYDDDDITIAVRRDLKATGSYGEDDLPCGFTGTRSSPAT